MLFGLWVGLILGDSYRLMFDGVGVLVSVGVVRYWVELGDWLDGLLLIWVA